LQKQKRYAEGLVEYREGHRLGKPKPDWPIRSDFWVRHYEHQERIARLLPRVESGEAQPANPAERAELGFFCLEQEKRTLAAVRFYEQALAEQPGLAAAVNLHRYNAACAAALAGCGQGQDAQQLSPEQRARLREQALTWMRSEREATRASLAKRPYRRTDVEQFLQHWQQDADLAGVRDAAGLDQLDEKESQQWHTFWKEVRDLQRQAKAKASAPLP